MDAIHSPEAGDLCSTCGLCCSGAIFSAVGLSEAEVGFAHECGLDVGTSLQGAPLLQFPCRALDGPLCRIYEQRPQSCHAYRCETLKALDNGAIALAEAQSRVEVALPLWRDAVEAIAPETIPQYRWRRAEALEAGEALPADARRAAILALDRVLDAHFRRPEQGHVAPFAWVEGRA